MVQEAPLLVLSIAQGLKPTKVKDANSGKFVNDYWETSKKMLSDMGFLDSLRTYDKVRQGALGLTAQRQHQRGPAEGRTRPPSASHPRPSAPPAEAPSATGTERSNDLHAR